MKLVTIKEYTSTVLAGYDRSILIDNGIIAEIENEYISDIMPNMQIMDPIRLVIRENDVERAKEVLGIE